MNEERTAIVNLALEGRLSPPDAARMLDALLDLELGSRCVVVPPCREPPWREAPEDLGYLMTRRDAAVVLASASRQLARSLPTPDPGAITTRLAVLDVAILADRWAGSSEYGTTFGGMAFIEREGLLQRGSVNVVFNGDPAGVWLFSHPLPQIPGRWTYEEAEERVEIVAEPEAATVTTGLGAFLGCLKVVRRTLRHGRDEEEVGEASAGGSDLRTVWLAPGVGPVRFRCETPAGRGREIDLIACGAMGGSELFPRGPERWWRFERSGPGTAHRELWRMLAPHEPFPAWMSIAAVIEDDSGD